MDDKGIIALYRSRDEQAVKETRAVYGNALYSLSLRILENHEDAEENEADTCLSAWNNIAYTAPVKQQETSYS